MKNKETGNKGEQEVIDLINCPNCEDKLILLPINNPLYDLQCGRCTFRAQVKTSRSKPKDKIFGSGWDIMDKVSKSGFLIPSLIVNFKWEEKGKKKQEIRFYPFLTRDNLHKRQLSPTAKRANYRMFNYKGLNKLPYFKLYEK